MVTINELDDIFDEADDFLLAGDFDAADRLFSVDIKTKELAWLLTLLTATVAAKDKLPSRKKFYEEVRNKFGDKMVEGLN